MIAFYCLIFLLSLLAAVFVLCATCGGVHGNEFLARGGVESRHADVLGVIGAGFAPRVNGTAGVATGLRAKFHFRRRSRLWPCPVLPAWRDCPPEIFGGVLEVGK